MSSTIVITGANRGIGLALVQRWCARGDRVIAVGRNASDTLRSSGAEVIDNIDVSRDADMPWLSDAVGEALSGEGFDVLFNNAGVMHGDSLNGLEMALLREQFETNALGPLRVTTALAGLLRDGGKVGLMSSRMGSVTDNDSGGMYGYRMSKAALNAAGRSLAVDLAARNIVVALLHPGFVRTAMTDHQGHIDADEAAAGVLAQMDALSADTSGTFRHADGSVLPW